MAVSHIVHEEYFFYIFGPPKNTLWMLNITSICGAATHLKHTVPEATSIIGSTKSIKGVYFYCQDWRANTGVCVPNQWTDDALYKSDLFGNGNVKWSGKMSTMSDNLFEFSTNCIGYLNCHILYKTTFGRSQEMQNEHSYYVSCIMNVLTFSASSRITYVCIMKGRDWHVLCRWETGGKYGWPLRSTYFKKTLSNSEYDDSTQGIRIVTGNKHK